MAKARPIKPGEIAKRKKMDFPDAVFEAFNEMIAQDFKNGSATVGQEAVVKLMIEKGLNRSDIFGKGWLNIEEVYRSAGWQVKYDSPAYDESFNAYFTFKH